jgi:nitrogen regulatory protein PII 1
MIMVRAIVRPEKSTNVLQALQGAGFPAVTKIEVFGRGKQQGLKLGKVLYDELPKEMLLLVVPKADKETVVNIILDCARSGEAGAFGDGKIFVSQVEEVYTISSGRKEV